MYKTKTYASILKEKIDDEISDDEEHCRFGQWYQGAGKELFGYTEAYKSVNDPHHKIHDNVKLNIDELRKNGLTNKNASFFLKNFTNMEEASKKVFKCLDDMVQEKFRRA
ncbi:MAG: CZB domain-containing protein [Sulfurospirillaceae bacterium]|nr:CZB domain-containing protein [Sulfurospirillaceae bacterium]